MAVPCPRITAGSRDGRLQKTCLPPFTQYGCLLPQESPKLFASNTATKRCFSAGRTHGFVYGGIHQGRRCQNIQTDSRGISRQRETQSKEYMPRLVHWGLILDTPSKSFTQLSPSFFRSGETRAFLRRRLFPTPENFPEYSMLHVNMNPR